MTLPLDHPFAFPPEEGQTLEVAPGVHWVRMPLPFALDHVNLWVIDDGEGWAVIDTGIGDARSQDLWDTLFQGPLAGKPVTRLICTHFHPDHMGLAGPLAARFGIGLTMTLGEWSYGRMLALEVGADYVENQAQFYRRAGYDADMVAGVRQRAGGFRERVIDVPAAVSVIRDGDVLTLGGHHWQIIVGRGHSPEHACLYCPDLAVLIAGDQILPRITPVVGVWPQEPEGDPLGDFLASLDKLRALPDDTLVLPAHRLPFVGLHLRADQIHAHHRERLALTLDACAQKVTALEAMKVLFSRPLDPYHTGFALGETLAHLHYLRARGHVLRSARADGVWLYQTQAVPGA